MNFAFVLEPIPMPHNTTSPAYNAELKHIRERLDLTQTEFGNLLGVTKMTVSRYECTGRHVPEPTIRLARALLRSSLARLTVPVGAR